MMPELNKPQRGLELFVQQQTIPRKAKIVVCGSLKDLDRIHDVEAIITNIFGDNVCEITLPDDKQQSNRDAQARYFEAILKCDMVIIVPKNKNNIATGIEFEIGESTSYESVIADGLFKPVFYWG